MQFTFRRNSLFSGLYPKTIILTENRIAALRLLITKYNILFTNYQDLIIHILPIINDESLDNLEMMLVKIQAKIDNLIKVLIKFIEKYAIS